MLIDPLNHSCYFICTIYTLFMRPFEWVVVSFIISNILLLIMATMKIFLATSASEDLNTSMVDARDHLQIFQVPNPTCCSNLLMYDILFSCFFLYLGSAVSSPLNSPQRGIYLSDWRLIGNKLLVEARIS